MITEFVDVQKKSAREKEENELNESQMNYFGMNKSCYYEYKQLCVKCKSTFMSYCGSSVTVT